MFARELLVALARTQSFLSHQSAGSQNHRVSLADENLHVAVSGRGYTALSRSSSYPRARLS
jgi:hypothetical protein